MREEGKIKPIIWMGSSKVSLKAFPEEVKEEIGFALFQAQLGKKHEKSKPLRGFGGAGVLEIVENFDGDTYRAVYTVKLAGVLYVLHAFQKKSRKGMSTPKHEIDLIKKRLKHAIELHRTMNYQ